MICGRLRVFGISNLHMKLTRSKGNELLSWAKGF